MAINDLCCKIADDLYNKHHSLEIFLDWSKAFDTFNHDILLQKRNIYGIRGLANLWIQNYLSNRKQYVTYNNSTSTHNDIVCGVPQGSILGPLLFLLYITIFLFHRPPHTSLFSLMIPISFFPIKPCPTRKKTNKQTNKQKQINK